YREPSGTAACPRSSGNSWRPPGRCAPSSGEARSGFFRQSRVRSAPGRNRLPARAIFHARVLSGRVLVRRRRLGGLPAFRGLRIVIGYLLRLREHAMLVVPAVGAPILVEAETDDAARLFPERL